MKVFVWKSHGEISIYAVETKEQQEALKAVLLSVLEDDGAEVSHLLDENLKYTLGFLYDWEGSDMFEYGTGVATVKELV